MALPRIQSLIIKKLGEYCYLNEEEVQSLLATKGDINGKALEKLLIDQFRITEFQLLIAKSKAFDLNPFVAKRFKFSDKIFEKLDEAFCTENQVLPVGHIGDDIIIAIANPFDLELTRNISKLTKCRVNVLLALEHELQEILKVSQKRPDETGNIRLGDVVDVLEEEYDLQVGEIREGDIENEESAPIIQLANRIIEEAYYSGASDIHIEPFEKDCRVRVRIDGICQDRITVPLKVGVVLVTRLKVMANLDIAEKRLPQDGRIVFKQFTKKRIDIDLRMSTAPLVNGEGVVMRILDKQTAAIPLESLGYEPENLMRYKALLERSYGMILHCGPTGSGKTTTLYAALNVVNKPGIVIRTAEDPIEYTQKGLCQMQVNPKIGLTFASALRSFLRQDPDVILIGEIRDQETARIAIDAALTGHLLFSTMHTNDAASTVTRMIKMGVEPFMISAALLCVCAQRLVRRVCNSCKIAYEAELREKEILEKSIGWSGTIYKVNPKGCPNCSRLGYRGRIGVHEIMQTSELLIDAINRQTEDVVLKRISMMDGMRTLHQDSMAKVKSGTTTMAEAIATAAPDLQDLEALKEEFEIEAMLKQKGIIERKEKLKLMRSEANLSNPN